MRSLNAMARRYGKLGRSMLPSFLLGAAITMNLAVAGLMSSAGAQPGSFETDDQGFLNTAARCEEPTFGVAFGRTQRSLVAICVDGGRYEYRGVRLSDNASLTTTAIDAGGGEFRAKSGRATYTFSAKELVITLGWWLRTEPMVAYVEPRLATER
jgi:hypothetical protein